MTMKTSLGETMMGLSEIGQSLIAAGVIVWSIRPPQKRGEGWAVNFRQRDRETAWEYGKPKDSLEEAMTDALQRLERLLESRKISHAAVGVSSTIGQKRFATLSGSERDLYRANGETAEDALIAALDQAEKALLKKGKETAPPPKPAAKVDPVVDDLDDLLG